MNKAVVEILDKRNLSPGSFISALKEITELYDKQSGSFPESHFEGLAFLKFCQGQPEPDHSEYLDYGKRIGSGKMEVEL